MLIQKQMGVQKVGCFIVFVVLLCALVAASSNGRKRTQELFLGNRDDSANEEIDEDMAELLWINCGLDLIHMKEAIGDLGLCASEEMSCSINEIISKCSSPAKENIQKPMCVLHPQIKQILLDCLMKKNLVFRVSGKDGGSKNWYDSLFPRPDAPRRYLGSELLQSIAETPARAPAVGSPIFAPAPSPDPPPSSSQQFFPPGTNDSIFQPSSGETSSAGPDSAPNAQSNKQNTSHKSVIVAVVVTASVTLIFSALLFLCYRKVCRTGSGVGQSDERPLLSLSLSNFSVGSSHMPFAVGSSINKEKLGNGSFSTNLKHNQKVSSLDGSFYIESDFLNASPDKTSSLAAIGDTAKSSAEFSDTSSNINAQVLHPPLNPPPGRVGNSTPGFLPLKSPPGRVDPLSPVPPPPGKANPSLPPPAPVLPPSLKFSGSAGPPPPGPPPPPPKPPGINPGPRPPPPPKSGLAPPRPPLPMAIGSKVPRPLGPNHSSNSALGDGVGAEGEVDAPKTKLKPFFWDKVLANPDQSMVWHQIKSGSFQFNEEMIESLFGYASTDKNKNERKKGSSSQEPSTQYIQIIDAKKSQNISILLRALNVRTEEVCDALHEGNELPSELLQTLLKMQPTAEEERKLRQFSGELSQLGPAERFLKALVDIPFAFKRLESLFFISSLQEDISITKESFATLEVACKELRNSRLFLKLLEAVLKTGNRMNDGTFRGGAQAFKLDTLLKLADVKGTDGKTTLLHFVVREIIRSEGVRAAHAASESQSMSSVKSDDLLEDSSHDSEEDYRSLGLQVVSGLGGELENVRKAAVLDADSLAGTVAKLGHALVKSQEFLNSMKSVEEDSGFHQTLKSFVQNAEIDITWLLEEEKRIMALVKSTGDYFHGKAGKDEGLRLFVIVRDFLIMLDKACKEVRDLPKMPTRTQKKEAPTVPSSSDPRQLPSPDLRQRLFPAIADRRMDYSSSDDETP